MTMLFIMISGTAIYAAADSRQFPLGNVTEKLAIVGNDAVILDAGIALIRGYSSPIWDVRAELARIQGDPPKGDFVQQLKEIGKRLAERFGAAISKFEEPLGEDPHVSFFLAKRENGKSFVAFQKLTVIDDGNSRRVSVEDEKLFTTPGFNWVAPEGCRPDRAEVEALESGWSKSRVEQLFTTAAIRSPDCATRIGLPISSVIIDDAGARRIQE